MTFEEYKAEGSRYTFLDDGSGEEHYPHWLVLDDVMVHQPSQITETLMGVGKEGRPDEMDVRVCFEQIKKKVNTL